MSTLSVLIPSREEMFLRHTVEDVLKHSSPATNVIVVCDGAYPMEPLDKHDRLRVFVLFEPIGQRAATNLAARLSDARYVMKLDAHCAVAPGFDVELMRTAEILGRDVTQIPKQHNLHVFDWRCEKCGHRQYQGKTPVTCRQVDDKARVVPGKGCGGAGPFERVLVWNPIRRPMDSWRFDASLVYQGWGGLKDRIDAEAHRAGQPAPDLIETMSCLGACWFLERERYWELDGLDEKHGSWGQMGTEVACKSWLSGGRMITNRRTWFSHMFRTQGEDFGFPYPLSGADRGAAREYSRRLWLNDAWPKQTRPLRWLIDHFWPVPDWTEAARDALPTALSREVAA